MRTRSGSGASRPTLVERAFPLRDASSSRKEEVPRGARRGLIPARRGGDARGVVGGRVLVLSSGAAEGVSSCSWDRASRLFWVNFVAARTEGGGAAPSRTRGGASCRRSRQSATQRSAVRQADPPGAREEPKASRLGALRRSLNCSRNGWTRCGSLRLPGLIGNKVSPQFQCVRRA